MRYLLITHDFYPNNIGGMTHYYTEIAQASGPEAMVVLTVASDEKNEETPGCRVLRAPVSGKKAGTFLGKRVMQKTAFRLVKEENIDAVLCGNVRPYGDIALSIHQAFGLPYYIFFHGNDLLRILARMKKKHHFIRRIHYNRMLGQAAGFITNSRYVMDLIPTMYKNEKKLLVLNPGIGKEFENLPVTPPFRNEGRVRLLTVGRLDKRKGVGAVLTALSLLKQRFPGLEYDVVGAGDPADYLKAVRDLSIEDRVRFHGFRSYVEIMDFFRSCDIFIMPSYASDKEKEVEGFGIVYLEAGAHGKPVIGSATGGIPDAVEDLRTGLLVQNPLDPEEIAEKISWMCEHTDEASVMGLTAHQRVNSAFTYSVIAEKLKTLT